MLKRIIPNEIQENTQRRVNGIILVEGFKKNFNTDQNVKILI